MCKLDIRNRIISCCCEYGVPIGCKSQSLLCVVILALVNTVEGVAGFLTFQLVKRKHHSKHILSTLFGQDLSSPEDLHSGSRPAQATKILKSADTSVSEKSIHGASVIPVLQLVNINHHRKYKIAPPTVWTILKIFKFV